jgi:hypothetical protein
MILTFSSLSSTSCRNPCSAASSTAIRPLMNWSAWILALLEQFDDRLVVVAVGTRADQLDLAHDPTERVDLRFVHPDGDIHNGAATSGTAVTTDRWAPRQR